MNWRKTKKIVRNRCDKIYSTGYFLDCFDHPCKMTEMYRYDPCSSDLFGDAEVDGESLIDGRGSSCSILYCAPEPLTKEEAEEIARNFNTQ